MSTGAPEETVSSRVLTVPNVLSALRRSGEPYQLSAGELVRETLVTSGTMTNRIDRLLARGMVARAPSESDRRTVLITLTSHGREAVDSALADLVTGGL